MRRKVTFTDDDGHIREGYIDCDKGHAVLRGTPVGDSEGNRSGRKLVAGEIPAAGGTGGMSVISRPILNYP